MKKRKIFYAVIILLLLLAVGLKFLNWQGEKSFNTLTEKSLDVFHEKDSETTGAVYETQDLSSLPQLFMFTIFNSGNSPFKASLCIIILCGTIFLKVFIWLKILPVFQVTSGGFLPFFPNDSLV